MSQKITENKKLNIFTALFVFVANADSKVIEKHPHTMKDIYNLALLMMGMATLVFGLQYLALSSYTGNHHFAVIAACMSAGIIVMLDRIVVAADFDCEGQIEYLKENKGDPQLVQKLIRKRAWSMGLRVALGVSIAYVAATLCMPKVLSFELEGYWNELELKLNPKSNQQLQLTFEEHQQQIKEKGELLEGFELGRTESRIRQGQTRRSLLGEIRHLQDKRILSESKTLAAKDCANAERTGRKSKICKSSGKIGDGYNYRYWRDQGKLYEEQIERTSQLIGEKQQQIEQSPETQIREDINQRMTEIKREISDLKLRTNSLLEIEKEQQNITGIRQYVVRNGPVAMHDAKEKIVEQASESTKHSLFLLKCWIMCLELAVFIARFAGCGREYALVAYREKLLRDDAAFLIPASDVIA